MDPLQPIVPGFRGQGHQPVERLERLSRERDRPEHDTPRRRRREAPREPAPDEPPEDDGLPHIDVRA